MTTMHTPDTLTIKEIAQALRLHPKHVRDRVVHRPDFPRPVLAGGRYSRQWLKVEVMEWARPKDGTRRPEGPNNS